MLRRGKLFYEKLVNARSKVAKLASNFITDGCVSFNNDIYIYLYIQQVKEA